MTVHKMMVDFPHTESAEKTGTEGMGSGGDSKTDYDKFMAFNANLL